MIKLLRWLLGYVEFAFSGGFSEGFLNDCYAHRYVLYGVRREQDALYACCPAMVYPYLRRAARQNGGRLRIISKHGLPFYLREFKGRTGLLAGLVCGIALVCLVSNYVWQIELVGNEKLSSEQVMSLLETNGLRKGVNWHSVETDRLEALLLAAFSECAWAHINRSGTTAQVEINEAVPRPDTFQPDAYANLKAKKDGVLVKAVVRDGWAVRQKGEAVVQGDLLVSGVYESPKGVNLFAHAAGEYIAEVNEPFSLTVSRTQQEKCYTAVYTFKRLALFGLEIPLYIGSSQIKNSDVAFEGDYWILNGETLPVGIVKKTVRTYVIKERILNDNELNALLQRETEKRLQEDFADAEIVSQDLAVTIDEDSAALSGTVRCLEDIGEEVSLLPSANTP